MFIRTFVAALLIAPAAWAQALPPAITCYQNGVNAKDIDAYMACFTDEAVMVDVSRTFVGYDAIKAWALREVLPAGDTFRFRAILEADKGYAKTEVNWLSWIVHYSYWWNESGKITRMSLQYGD